MTPQPLYVADTVALVRYLEESLPPKADEAFERAETGRATMLVPDIAVAELIYVALKGRLKVSDPRAAIRELLDDIRSSPYLRQAGLSPEAWDFFLDSTVSELHDRMIYATASFHKANGIVTNDRELAGSGFHTIW